MKELERITRGAEETHSMGADFATLLTAGDIVLLYGDLGCGKTVFTQGIAAGLGVDPGIVQSPTYTLIHEYRQAIGEFRQGGKRHKPDNETMVVHIDLYRLSTAEVESTGVDESLAGPGIKIVEWADRLPWRPRHAWMISIEQIADDERRIQIRRDDP